MDQVRCVLYFVLSCYVILACFADIRDATRSVTQIIKNNGYPLEEHTVITPDGYILSVYRLPNPNAKESILLVHGLLGSSSDFILLGPGRALGYFLFENGYDVWILNCRGTKYSINHTSLKSTGVSKNQYWNFSVHELGYYDVPSTVDHILEETKRTQIVYYGHSQGTTALLIMLSERPEYNTKVKAAILAAPTAFLCHITNRIVKTLIPQLKMGLLRKLRKLRGNFDAVDILPSFSIDFFKISCESKENIMTAICLSFLYELVNATPSEVAKNLLPIFFSHYPNGASLKQLTHFSQGVLACKFKKFQEDFNESSEDYRLENIEAPIYALIAENDTVQDIRDTTNLERNLKNGFRKKYVIENWGHADFGFAKSVPRRVYDKVLEIIESA